MYAMCYRIWGVLQRNRNRVDGRHKAELLDYDSLREVDWRSFIREDEQHIQ